MEEKSRYDFNRLRQITYPESPPVVYAYGDASEAGETGFQRAGRVKQETSEAGTKTYEFDTLGNIAEQSWTLNSLRPPQTATIAASMNYSYDSFGRLLTVVFPGSDNEAVTYGYDHGGNVTSAVGVDNTGGEASRRLSRARSDLFAGRARKAVPRMACSRLAGRAIGRREGRPSP